MSHHKEYNLQEMTLKRYDSYKHSGIDWLGDIPTHWEVKKLKNLFYEKKKVNDENLKCGAISFGKVIEKDDEKIPLSTKASYQVLNKGEFLINPLNLNYDLKSLRIALSDLDLVVSSGYMIIKNKKDMNKNYFKWFLHMYDILFMKTLGAGVRQTLNYNDIANTLVVFPPLQEQKQIADYLDKKINKIDEAIKIREKTAKSLKEYRQALINETVTKGLDKSIPLKHSGIDWLGDIPTHWEVRKGKYLFKQIKRPAHHNDEIITCFRDGTVTLRTNRRTEGFTNALKEIGYQGVKKGDFVIHNMDAFAGAIGVSDSDGKCTPVYSICRPYDENLVSSEYYAKYLRNLALQNFILSLAKGVRERSSDFRFKDFSELFYPLPPLQEQKQIADYLDKKINKIDEAIELQNNYITKLKEYKNTLIDSAVTGKIRITY